MTARLYRLLDHPAAYTLVQLLVSPGIGRLEGKVYRELFAGCKGLVLDVGCGPRLRTPAPEGVVVGLDVHEDYVRAFTGGFLDTDPALAAGYAGPRKQLGYVGSAAAMPFADGTFDEVRCRAILHHLPPETVRVALGEMIRVVRPGGRVVVLDCVWPRRPLLRPLAWLMMRLDRGEWMRSETELVALAEAVAPGGWTSFRYTAAYLGQEAVVLTHRKPAAGAAAA